MMKTILITIFAIIVAVNGQAISECTRLSSQPLGPFPFNVTVSNCRATDARCNIRRSTPITAMVDFIATNNIESLRPHITAHALGQIVFYDLDEETLNGCNHVIGTFCPLDEQEFVTYNFSFDVGNEYPLIDLNIELRLFDENDNIQFCFDLASTVVP